MARIRFIRLRRTYTISELAELLDTHVRTAQSWCKKGLTPIDPDDRPRLYLGSEIKRFLSQWQKARKSPLKDGEFFCPRCRTARESYIRDVRLEDTGRRLGKSDISVLIKGKCTKCDCPLTRFSTRRRVSESVWLRKLRQGQASLYGDHRATVNTDIEGDECDANKC